MESVSLEKCAREILEVVPLVMRTIRAEMRQHSAVDLSVPQFRTLGYLNRWPGASLSDVAYYLGLTLPSMSATVEALVERKLISRHPRAADRRCVTLALTARGQATLETSLAATQAQLAQKLAALSTTDQAAVVQAMQALGAIFST